MIDEARSAAKSAATNIRLDELNILNTKLSLNWAYLKCSCLSATARLTIVLLLCVRNAG